MMKRSSLFVLGGLLLVLAGCGERPQTISAAPGTTAAKPDDKPYQNDQFKGDKDSWQRTLRARADHQNEYKRVN